MADSLTVQDAIIGAATEAGIDPAWALSVAEREFNFDPDAKASKTIRGVFQMTKGLRDAYGAGDSNDPAVQARGFMNYVHGEVEPQMRSVLGRDPTPQETYLGHHFGPARAAHYIAMGEHGANTPVADVFTQYERSINPHFDRAGTFGNLTASINNDMDKRMAKYGGGAVASAATPTGTAAANTAKTPFEESTLGSSLTLDDLAHDDPKVPEVKKAKTKPKEENDWEPLPQITPIQTAVAPPVPAPTQNAVNMPAMPSLANAQMGLPPKTVLGGKPIMDGLAALMGNPNG